MPKAMMHYTLGDIAKRLQAQLRGDADKVINGVASLHSAQADELSFLSQAKFRDQLAQTNAGAVIMTPEDAADCPVNNCLLLADPYRGFVNVAKLFAYCETETAGIHPSAIVGDAAEIDPSVTIGPYAVIGEGVKLAAGVRVGAHCIIGDYCELGDNTELKPRVTLAHHVIIGQRSLIHSGAVIGADGFGNLREGNGWGKIPQLGTVEIGNDVEIGANTTIDRGTLDNTIVANGVKLDNLIHLGHNVKIGENTAIAGCVGIAGSATIGKQCMIGGLTGINGHITIADGVIFTAMSMVTGNVSKPGIYSSGTGILPNRLWRKNAVRFRYLDETMRKLKLGVKSFNQTEEN